jgi:hypothetical protein
MISVIGNGFVGGAVAYGFSQLQPKVYVQSFFESTSKSAVVTEEKYNG